MAALIPDWVENAMADAKRRRTSSGESEFGKPVGDTSPPTPGRHVPPARRRIAVSHVGPGPGVGG